MDAKDLTEKQAHSVLDFLVAEAGKKTVQSGIQWYDTYEIVYGTKPSALALTSKHPAYMYEFQLASGIVPNSICVSDTEEPISIMSKTAPIKFMQTASKMFLKHMMRLSSQGHCIWAVSGYAMLVKPYMTLDQILIEKDLNRM